MPARESARVPVESAEAEYERLNFQPPDVVEELAVCIAGASRTPGLPVVLSGEQGIGRRYLVRSALFKAARRGAQAALAVLDLDGWEPERGGLAAYLEHRLRHEEPGRREVLRQALDQAPLAVSFPSVWLAALLSIGLSLELPPGELREMLAGVAEEPAEGVPDPDALVPTPQAPPTSVLAGVAALERALRRLTAGRRLVLHVAEAEELTAPLRRFLLDQARAHPELLLVLSCRPGTPTDRIAPGQRVVRVELARLDRREVREVVDFRFPAAGAPAGGGEEARGFEPDLYEALWRRSQGRPGDLAAQLQGLCNAGGLAEVPGAGWRLAEVEPAHAHLEELSADPFAPFEAALTRLPPWLRESLWNWLARAVLCGPYAPSRPLLAAMGLSAEEAEEVEDRIDELLVEDPACALFGEARFDHPAFPGLAAYELISPLRAGIVRQRVGPGDLGEAARELLARLPRLLPASRGAARLFLALAEASGEEAAVEAVSRQLSWWVGLDELEALRDELAAEVRAGRLRPDLLWGIASSTRTAWPAFRRLPLLDAFAARKDEIPPEVAGPFWYLHGEALLELQAGAVAAESFERAARSLKAHRGEDHADAAASLQRAGLALLTAGDAPAARDRLEEAVRIWERLGTESWEGLGQSLEPLGQVLLLLGDMDGARRAGFRALSLAEREGSQRAWWARGSILSYLAAVSLAESKPDEALALAREALPILERFAQGGEPWQIDALAACLDHAGRALADLGQPEEAREHLLRALALYQGREGGHAATIRARLAELGKA